MGRPLPGQAPFVGRARELTELTSLAAGLRDGRGWLATVSGGAGVGKSRLIKELIAEATARGVTVLVGFCDEEAPQDPYEPVADAIRAGLRDADAGERSRIIRDTGASIHALLPELDDTGIDRSSPARPDRAAVADAVLRALDVFGRPNGVLLIIEDLHAASRATTSLLRYLARRLDRIPAGVLVSWRAEETDAPLRAFAADLHTRSSVSARIELPPLTWSETREFVRKLFGWNALPPTAFVDQLYERTEGNAFYVEELVHALDIQDGAVPLAIPERLPDTLNGMMRERVQRLGSNAERVIATAAVFGRRFSADALTDVAGLDELAVEKSIALAIQHNLIAEDGAGFAFRHALLQEAATASLLAPERRRLHLRIAHALERDMHSARVDPSAALAHHYGRAGDREAQRLYAERAGDDAAARGAAREAAAWYAEALRLAGDLDEPEPLPLLEKSARLFTEDWRLREAEAVYDRLIAARREGGDARALGETIALSAMTLFNDPKRRLERLEAAMEILQPLGESVALARAMAGVAALYLSLDHPDAFDVAIAARSMARATGTIDAEANALRVIGTIAVHGDLALGARVLRDGVRIATQNGMNAEAYISSFNLAGAFVRVGRWDDAEAGLRPSYEGAVRQNVPDAIGTSLIRLAEINHQRGDWAEADRLLEQARLRIDATDVSARMLFAFQSAYLDAGRGRWQHVLDAIEPIIGPINEKDQKMDVAVANSLLAAARRATGDLDAATRHAEAVLRALRLSGDHYSGLPHYELVCEIFVDNGRIGDAKTLISELGELRDRVEHKLNAERVHALLDGQYRRADERDARPSDDLGAMARAVIDACAAVVAEAEGNRDEAVQRRDASLAFWRVADFPYVRARCEVQLASALLARSAGGDRDAAREHLVAAQETFVRLGAADAATVDALLRKHRMVAPAARRAGSALSAREMEVAVLVARGDSNREIAAALVLSTRTVDHHVSRILAKLDLPSRTALAAFAAEHGLI